MLDDTNSLDGARFTNESAKHGRRSPIELKSTDETESKNTIVIWSWDALNKTKQFLNYENMKINLICQTG